MASFEILEEEGMHYVKIGIQREMVHAERGALCWMTGNIEMDARIPFIGSAIKSYLSEEAFIRPTYSGTGTIYLESSLGGFHIFEVADSSWILGGGVYWASEGSIQLAVQRERMWTSFWAGEGLIDWQTKLTGRGKVVINTYGPVNDRTLQRGEQVVVNGNYVLARTADVAYRMRRATKTLAGSYLAGEGYCRCYEGPGRILLSATPFWRYRIFSQQPPQTRQVAAAE